jgi:hypothetical protein
MVREGLMRAALTEFVSIEDVLQLDLQDLGLHQSPLRLNDTDRPLLHIFRELRNHEVHLRHGRLRSISRDVSWGHYDRQEEATPLTIELWLLDGVTAESFGTLRNARAYGEADIRRMVELFNFAQAEWGIQDLFLNAVEEYCCLLADAVRKSDISV